MIAIDVAMITTVVIKTIHVATMTIHGALTATNVARRAYAPARA